jgi:hypothetical protein
LDRQEIFGDVQRHYQLLKDGTIQLRKKYRNSELSDESGWINYLPFDDE